MITTVTMRVPATAFVAITELLTHVRLGNRNKWETSLAGWVAEADKQGLIDALMPELLEQEGYPTVKVEASESDGLVINLE